MPPARPRADDSRSETSSVIANHKDHAATGAGILKSRKNGAHTTTDSSSTFKIAAVNGALAVTQAILDAAGGAETPQTDWASVPIPVLHTYRAAYKLPTPASYTQPHAELIYNSSHVAKRSPSQVLARRKLEDLRRHRKKIAQINGTSSSTKSSKSKSREKDRDGSSENTSRDSRRKAVNGTQGLQPLSNGDLIAQSIEPVSPTIASASERSDSQPSTLLNSSNPEATIIGRQSPTLLATNIRKHFNAQPLHEQETIARFTYIMRQQGFGTAGQIAAAGGNNPAGSATSTSVTPKTSKPIRVEGSEGDGFGWVMGSMGREVRMTDSGGGGAFRLRFRPQA